jgi:hypothetical protein
MVGRAMSSTSETQEAIARQILGEKASALGRTVEALEAALAAFRAAAAAHAARPGEATRLARREALDHAGERLWFAVIHREAMGLLRHEVLYETLAVPAEVRAAMGPATRRSAPGA